MAGLQSTSKLKCSPAASSSGTGAPIAGAESCALSELLNEGVVVTSSVVLIGSFFWVSAARLTLKRLADRKFFSVQNLRIDVAERQVLKAPNLNNICKVQSPI